MHLNRDHWHTSISAPEIQLKSSYPFSWMIISTPLRSIFSPLRKDRATSGTHTTVCC